MGKNYFETLCGIICENSKVKQFKISPIEKCKMKLSNNLSTYEIVYDFSKKQVDLLESNTPNSDSKVLSSWYLDSNSSTQKNIALIANDFIDLMDGKNKYSKPSKKKTTNTGAGGNSSGGLFFANRMVNIFPQLKEEIQIEKESYSEFRSANFAINNILPKVQNLITKKDEKSKTTKLAKLLSELYQNAALDIRSIITMGILNGLEGEHAEQFKFTLGEELQEAWDAARKYKGKKVKPEKLKNKQSLLSKALEMQKLQ